MTEYHKIDTIFKRDMEAPNRPLLFGQWSKPEFQYLAECEWEFTEKVDGTNIRIMWNGFDVKISGRTDRAQIHADLYDVLVRMFPAWKMSEVFPFRDRVEHGIVTLYGEGYGAGIQKVGSLYRKDKSFVLFDIRVGQWWLRRDDMIDLATQLGGEYVPTIAYGTLNDAIDVVKAGYESQWGQFTAEGLVCRPRVELAGRDGKRIICKIKHRDFFQGAINGPKETCHGQQV